MSPRVHLSGSIAIVLLIVLLSCTTTATARTIDVAPAGRLVRALADGPQAPGTHVLVWDGRAASGARAGSGVYFCKLTCKGETRTRHLVLVR